ncbi:hypothetical protein NONI108955_38975 [Nocardia ninae]|uniref:Uncharacterized protein n=2 Tax=Nocardia TaxID=1817 RepID=A0A511MMN5_9NOCA|nr:MULTISPECIES: hypothetical protein [Nocardia]QBS44177.1 hypothetical protein DMB37_32870 [Nocardia sp. CS682]GEM41872.1 hypothetical protein NN4_63910 [Nocardia ninae NBRC 108245]
MYPSQPEGRHAAPGGAPSQPPRMVGLQSKTGPQGAPNALATFVTYAKALESLDKNHFPDEYATHADRIKELRPFLRAHGILDVMQIKNPEVAALLGV